MDVVSGIIIFILGAIVGAFAFKTLSASSQEQVKLSEKVSESEAELAKYKEDVAEHLDNSTQLLSQMNEACQAAMKQMEQSTQLLNQATPENTAAMPFFSQETQEQLAKTAELRHNRERKSEDSLTEQPLDYSDNPSGLFDDKKQSVTNSE
ncbi:YhcB family protein [Thalassotalea eurytherma]|uniref:DUF1043 family protein n=1 Tax=Thalassotalea eurytherma TaxID=1144278 RepID=A0ABQ6H580_9GAMM|nr:DUF1043 family protein [Thalassotalea eurytherma]GLX83310.1 hypothetical protein theurythT_27620 [Thalassotalea eurytherma]